MLTLPPIASHAQSQKQDSLLRAEKEEDALPPSSLQGDKIKPSLLPRISTAEGTENQPLAKRQGTSGLSALEPLHSRGSNSSRHRGAERQTPSQTFQFDADRGQTSANRVSPTQPSESSHRKTEERPQPSHDGRNEVSTSRERNRVNSSKGKPSDGKTPQRVNDPEAYSPVRPHSLDSGIGRSHSGQSKDRVDPFRPSDNQQSLHNRRGYEDTSEVESIPETPHVSTVSQPRTKEKIESVRKSHTQVDTKVSHPRQSEKTRSFKKSRTQVVTTDEDKAREQPSERPILAPRERSKAYKALKQEIRNVKTPRAVAKEYMDTRKRMMESYTFRTARHDTVPINLRSIERREKQTQEAVHQILQKENHLRISQKKKIEDGKETGRAFHSDVSGAIKTYTRQISNAHAPQRSHSVVGRSTASSVQGRRCHSERPLTRQLTQTLKKAEKSYDQRWGRNKRQHTFLTQVTELQNKAAREHQREAVRRRQLAADSRSRQAWQLYFLRDKFEKERRKRFAGQYVTSRVLRHEIVDRHHYGLPDTLSASGRKSTVSRPSRNSTVPPRRSTGSSLSHYRRARKTFRYMFEEPRGPRPFHSLSRTRTHITKGEAIAMSKETERMLQEANQLLAASLDRPPGSERHTSEAPKLPYNAPQPKAQKGTVHQKVARSLQKTTGPRNATSQSTNRFAGEPKTISQLRGNNPRKTSVTINTGALRNSSYNPTPPSRRKNETRSNITKPSLPTKAKGKPQTAEGSVSKRAPLSLSKSQSGRYDAKKTPLASTLTYDLWARKPKQGEQDKNESPVESNERPSKRKQQPERKLGGSVSGSKDEYPASDAVKDTGTGKKVAAASKAGEPKPNTALSKDPEQMHEPRPRQSKQQAERIAATPAQTSTPVPSQNRKSQPAVKPTRANSNAEPLSSARTTNKSSTAASNSGDPPKRTDGQAVTLVKPQPVSTNRRDAVRSKLAKSLTQQASAAPKEAGEIKKDSDSVSHPLTFKPAQKAPGTKRQVEKATDSTPAQTGKKSSSKEAEQLSTKPKVSSELDNAGKESRDFYAKKPVSRLGYSAPKVADNLSDDESLLEADDIWERAIRKYNIRLDDD